MPFRSNQLLLVAMALPLLHCGAPSDVDTSDAPLRCLTCGGGGDPPPPPPPPKKLCYRDNDHDGVGGAAVYINGTSCSAPYVNYGGDCDDNNASITYGIACYKDADGDGHYGTYALTACSCPAGYAASIDDCNDSDASAYQQVWCDSATDNDHDGYAAAALLCVNPNNCPKASKHSGDCNDGNAAVHPEQDETAADGIDNDCNGLTDEITFSYYADSSQSTSSSLRIWFKVHDVDIINYARTNQPLWALASYAPLTNSAAVSTSAPLPVTIFTGSLVFGYFDLAGLQPATTYRVTMQLVTHADGTGGFGSRGMVNIPSQGFVNATLWSTGYFQSTMQAGVNPLEQGRAQVVNHALHEWNDSVIGVVKDGNRYCSGYSCDLDSVGGHEWCSEFYNSMLTTAFVSLDPYTPGIDYDSDNIRNAFGGYSTWTPGTALLQTADAGDYLGVGVPNLHHSEMFIALDTDGHPWMVSGNINNRVAFSHVPDDPSTWINGMGHLMSNMLK